MTNNESDSFNLRIPLGNSPSNAEEDRTFITKISKILSGERELHINPEEHNVYVYTKPNPVLVQRFPELKQKDYGTLEYHGTATYVNHPDYDSMLSVIDVGDAEMKVEFLREILNIVHDRRFDVALPANKQMSQTERTQATAPGWEGHLLKQYNSLLDQIEKEFYYQRREAFGE